MTGRGDSDTLHEGHYREILALIKGVDGRLQAGDERMREISTDAREARDAANRLTERFNTQDVPARISEVKALVERLDSERRSDLVNSASKITTEMREGHDDHEGRIKELEDARHRMAGATGLIGWIGRNAPWLLTGLIALAAVFGVKVNHP